MIADRPVMPGDMCENEYNMNEISQNDNGQKNEYNMNEISQNENGQFF